MANTKLDRIERDIEKTRAKILEQQSVNAEGSPVSLRVGGRHDICAIPRVNPVLEAMAALTVADALLLQRRMG